MDLLLLFDMPNFASPEVWLSLLTLTFLEIVLGIDNIIFIAIAAAAARRAMARSARMRLLLFGSRR